MTRTELADLFTPIYDHFYSMTFDENSMVSPKLCDVITDSTKDWKYNAISGLGEWGSVDEDSDDGLDHFVIGYEGTSALAKYRKYFYVTFEVTEQMEYASLKAGISKAEALARGGRSAVENYVADKFYGGFSTAGADGEYLISAAHPKNPEETGITYSNLLSGAFSHDALEAAEKQIADNHFDLDGEPFDLTEKPILLYSPAINGTVQRVLNERANTRPGTDHNDINIFAGKYIPLEWVRLSAAMGGSDTAWYIVFPGTKLFKFIWGQRPQFSSWIDNLKQRYYFDGWEHFHGVITDWRYLFGSTGL